MTKKKILIADDHPLVLNGLKKVTRKITKDSLIYEAVNGNELMETLRNQLIDYVITDLGMPGKNGIELCRYIRENYPDIKLMVITQFSEAYVVKQLIKLEIKVILFKLDSTDEIESGISHLLESKSFLGKSVNELILNEFQNKSSPSSNFVPVLTAREKEVLQEIANEHTNHEIAAKLNLSPKTIENYRNRLLMKLEVKNTEKKKKKGLQYELIK